MLAPGHVADLVVLDRDPFAGPADEIGATRVASTWVSGSKVSIEVAEGVPGDAVVEAAQRLGCDLVIMATHGRSGLGRAVLGSVADHVVRHVHSAVLLVRPTNV